MEIRTIIGLPMVQGLGMHDFFVIWLKLLQYRNTLCDIYVNVNFAVACLAPKLHELHKVALIQVSWNNIWFGFTILLWERDSLISVSSQRKRLFTTKRYCMYRRVQPFLSQLKFLFPLFIYLTAYRFLRSETDAITIIKNLFGLWVWMLAMFVQVFHFRVLHPWFWYNFFCLTSNTTRRNEEFAVFADAYSITNDKPTSIGLKHDWNFQHTSRLTLSDLL